MTDINEAIKASLKKAFGYDPLPFEKWVVYKNDWLIVIRADQCPRVYKRHAGGRAYELDPEKVVFR